MILIYLLICTSIEATKDIEETALGIRANDGIESDLLKIIDRGPPQLPTTIAFKNRFANIIHWYEVFVDKTMLIKELLEYKDSVILITRPRKLGKSVNLDMMKLFVELTVKNGTTTMASRHETRNYKLFTNGELFYNNGTALKLEHPLMIAKDKEFLEQHLGRYPVIYASFKGWGGSNYDKLIENFRSVIAAIFRYHDYVQTVLQMRANNESSTPEQIAQARKNLELFTNILEKRASVKETQEAILLLSKLLREHFGNPVIILIDDYEYPLVEIVFENAKTFKDKEKKQFVEFYHDFLAKSFKNNVHMKKAVLTGVLRLVNEERFHTSTSIPKHGGIDDRFFQYYGFTQREVDLLLTHVGVSDFKRSRVHGWYNGYESRKPSSWRIYNPYSVMIFVVTDELDHFWMKTDTINNEKCKFPIACFDPLTIIKIVPLRSDMDQMIRNGEACMNETDLHFHIEDYLTFRSHMAKIDVYVDEDISDFEKHRDIMTKVQRVVPKKLIGTVANLALSYFWAHGYITHSHLNKSKIARYLHLKNSSDLVWFRLATYEVKWGSKIDKTLTRFYEGPYDGDEIMHLQENFDDARLLHWERFLHDDCNSVMEKVVQFIRNVCLKYGLLNGIDIVFYAVSDIDYVGIFDEFYKARISHHPSMAFYKEQPEKRIVLLKLTHDEESAEKALQTVVKYGSLIQQANITDKIKFIGINAAKTWTMCYYTLFRVSQGWFNINGDNDTRCIEVRQYFGD